MQWLLIILIVPYVFILTGIYRSLLRIKPFKPQRTSSPFVTVVVACRNEEEHLPGLLRSLFDQDYPTGSFEVIIVDDHSTDRTIKVVSEFEGSGNIRIIINAGEGKKQALRTGINAASGNFIVTTDADCIMGKYWMRTIAEFYSEHKPDMIICPVKTAPLNGFFGRFQELEFLSLQGITAGTAFSDNGTMCNGANLAFTREAYFKSEKNLHFEIPTGDDVFFLHSLKKQEGSKILWLESLQALVTTSPSPTILSYFRQRRRWVSKSKAYTDSFSILLGAVTFLAILLQLSLLIAGLFNHVFLVVFAAALLLKSVPDFLILHNTTLRYGRSSLMAWFLPAQIIYPFYVFGVVLFSVISPRNQEY